MNITYAIKFEENNGNGWESVIKYAHSESEVAQIITDALPRISALTAVLTHIHVL